MTATAGHDSNQTFFRYLPASEELRAWGMYVTSVGYSRIGPGRVYPPAKHPADHHFTWQRGRVLFSPSFVYITRGGGRFESQASGALAVREGDLLLLFPGVWHRYRPDPNSGWDEQWVEFDGPCARRFLERKELQPARPLLQIGLDDGLVELLQAMIDCARDEPYGFEYTLAGLAVQVIAQVLVAVGRRRMADHSLKQVVCRAKSILTGNLADNVDLTSLARQLNVSYTRFRRTFKEYTGFSPRQFQLHHRIHRAARLLSASTLPVQSIAAQHGFQSLHYFSELFKRRMGCSPQAYRKRSHRRRESDD